MLIVVYVTEFDLLCHEDQAPLVEVYYCDLGMELGLHLMGITAAPLSNPKPQLSFNGASKVSGYENRKTRHFNYFCVMLSQISLVWKVHD